MNQKQKCIILSLCLHIASPRKPWEFYLSYTTVEGEGDKGGEVDKEYEKSCLKLGLTLATVGSKIPLTPVAPKTESRKEGKR